MPEDLYGEESSQEPEASSETSVLPKSFFSGKELKPGGRCEIEVVRVNEEDVEVRYSSSKEEGETPDYESSEQLAPMPNDMAAMME